MGFFTKKAPAPRPGRRQTPAPPPTPTSTAAERCPTRSSESQATPPESGPKLSCVCRRPRTTCKDRSHDPLPMLLATQHKWPFSVSEMDQTGDHGTV